MKRLTGASVIALSVMAAPALADVTAQQVWDDLHAYMESFGYTVEGAEAPTDGGLTVSDVVMSVTFPEDGGDMRVSIPEIMLTDRGDGSVGVTFPEVMPIAVSVNADGEQVDLVVDYTHSGLEMIVSGDEAEMTYAYSAETLRLALSDLVVEGETIPREMARFDVIMAPVEGQSVVATTDGLRTLSQDMTMGAVTYSFAGNDEDGGEGGLFNGSMNAVTLSGNSAIPTDVDMEDPTAFIKAGLSADAEIRHEGGQLEFSVTERKGTTSGQSRSGAGFTRFAFDGQRFEYSAGGEAFSMAMSGPEIPLPINVDMDEMGMSLSLPLAKSETPQMAGLDVTLAGLAVSEVIWNVFDPGAALPRDPATITLDLVAQVTPFADLFDEEAMDALGDAPGQIDSLTLENLLVEAAGGRISGEGAFTFDNTDLESFEGLPRPEGELNLSVSGANGLIDALIQMGVLEESDAMGARMMLSMFTVPGSAPDSATSKIEVNSDGHVLANGQRIR